jgi:hypothetical protein
VILRPITAATPHSPPTLPAWTVIERTQRECAPLEEFWMVPQPAHAALSGDIAARLSPESFPKIDPEIVRAISLHDAGWGSLDAASIQDSRGGRKKPYSFISAPPAQFTAAWTASIETAQKVNDIGGYIVSAHFFRISELHPGNDKALETFRKHEHTRQRRLRADIALTAGELDRLVEALQFCDVLSLYLCCGTEDPVEFPHELAGRKISMQKREGEFVCDPSPFRGEHLFQFNALRHPRRKESPSCSFSQAVR